MTAGSTGGPTAFQHSPAAFQGNAFQIQLFSTGSVGGAAGGGKRRSQYDWSRHLEEAAREARRLERERLARIEALAEESAREVFEGLSQAALIQAEAQRNAEMERLAQRRRLVEGLDGAAQQPFLEARASFLADLAEEDDVALLLLSID